VKYAFIEANQRIFSITRMCKVLNVKPSSYYDWVGRGLSGQKIHRNQCELLVRVAHTETKQCYGVDRLQVHLSEQGHDISHYMVRSIKEEHDIKCRRHKRFKVTTDSNHNKLVYPNVLDQKFDAKCPNLAKQCFSGSVTLLDISSCTTIRLGFKRVWPIRRQDRYGLTFIVRLHN